MPKIVEDVPVYRAAMQTVIARGYAGATTKQIADAAGVSEVTLFRKYGNKANLIKLAMASMLERMNFAEATRYTGDVEADLRRVVQTYQALTGEIGQFFPVMMAELPRYPELSELLSVPMSMVNTVAALLARYQSEGVLRAENPMHTVTALLGPLIATNMFRGTLAEPPLPPLDLEQHVAAYLRGRLGA